LGQNFESRLSRMSRTCLDDGIDIGSRFLRRDAGHNGHLLSPKRDFKLNDVMGGIAITLPLE